VTAAATVAATGEVATTLKREKKEKKEKREKT
jgi:hypothetical protein